MYLSSEIRKLRPRLQGALNFAWHKNQAPIGNVVVVLYSAQKNQLLADVRLQDDDVIISNSQGTTFFYQWYADGQQINGANDVTLILNEDQLSRAITVKVRYVDGYGASESVTSPALRVKPVTSASMSAQSESMDVFAMAAVSNDEMADRSLALTALSDVAVNNVDGVDGAATTQSAMQLHAQAEADVAQLIQAMAGFAPEASARSKPVLRQAQSDAVTLAAAH